MHDLRKPLRSLVDILSSHDVPLAFLFGSGTSCCVSVPSTGGAKPLIPAVFKLTQDCRAHVESDAKLGGKFKVAWNEIEAETEKLASRRDIEAVLSRVRLKRDALLNTEIHGLSSDELAQLETQICKYIAKAVAPPESEIPSDLPHDQFSSWLKAVSRKRPIEIFTTNYDVLIERSLEALRVPLFDGFVGSYRPYFDASLFDRDNAEVANSWVRLWKIHGSVTWHLAELGSVKSIYRGEIGFDGEMILPSHYKYDESRKMPYRAMHDRLGRILDQPGTTLITCGYSFSDEHINETLITHSDRSNATVVALMFEELDESSAVIRLSKDRMNFTVLGPSSGRYKGRFEPWSPESVENTAEDSSLSVVLDKELVKIGDFNRFAAFLTSLDSGGE